MNTDTVPRIIATDDRRCAMIANPDITVVASENGSANGRRLHIQTSDYNGPVTISVSDTTDRVVLFIGREEARLLAQAILDATA